MKKITFFMAAIAMVAFTTKSAAQETASGVSMNGTSTATVITPLKLELGDQLKFGNVTEYGLGGTIMVASVPGTTVATPGGDAQSMGGSISPASFTVTGQTGETFVVTLPGVDDVINLNSSATGAVDMPVKTFTSNISTGVVGTDATFYVGATLHLNPKQAAGSYEGQFPVTVQYQ